MDHGYKPGHQTIQRCSEFVIGRNAPVFYSGAVVALKICFRLPGRRLCRRGQHRQEDRKRIGPKDKWGTRWRNSGGSPPPPPPPRSPPPTSHPPLPEARRFSPGNLGALLPPDSGSTGSKKLLPDTGHSRNSPHELLPMMDLCTGHNHGLRIIST